MKIVLVANPYSGGKKIPGFITGVKDRLNKSGVDVDLYETQYHGHAMEIIKQISMDEFDAVVSMGGDGTNYEVLNGILKYHGEKHIPPLGIIPAGRGNSFAKDLDIHSVGDGISAIVRGKTRSVDVCRFSQGNEYHYFVNLMGFGFVADVAKTAESLRWAGNSSYVIGVIYRTILLRSHKMTLEIDGRMISEDNCFVEFCNSRYTGGDMLMAPDARIDDGLFDVVIVKPSKRFNLLSTFPKIFKGTHGENPAVRFVQGKSAKVHTDPPMTLLPDGDLFGSTPTEITLIPGLVRYFS